MEMTLSKPPVVDALQIEAAGLEAKGRVALKDEGALDRVTFEAFRVGSWLEGVVPWSDGARACRLRLLSTGAA